ncbi:methylamine utilization protein MauE [Nonomuraea deserti]|uniref:Methylamine utilization protein MauE n=1 Tax=Nonomuraea deserti TaxID=1848322 RepID=A0A4R4W864_9ACTN|nr:MauE/DoxX family redox-associated membrane protein [Nonomuraea deserti]TDD11934.1 methylamine utilization protein MauE [Nonomuraea deserti]
MQYVEVASRLLLVTVFAFALAGKVRGRRAWAGFVESLSEMAVIGRAVVPAAAVAVIAAEAAVIVLVLLPPGGAATAGFALAAVLLSCFTLAVGAVARRAAPVPCRCFGASETPVGVPHVVRNLILVTASLLGLVGSLTNGSVDPVLGSVAGILGAVLGLLMARWDDLAALLRPSWRAPHASPAGRRATFTPGRRPRAG